jgi:hypothetical protein
MFPSPLKDGFERIVIEAEEIAADVNRSLDAYERHLDAPLIRKLLELGILLGSVRDGRSRAEELSRLVPSPNQVPEALKDTVATVGQALFDFVESCHAREAIIDGMAAGLYRRLAA